MKVLIVLLICHYLADYVLVTKEMLAAKSKGFPCFPIAKHTLVHTILMGLGLAILGYFNLFALSLQFITHLLIDIGKGKLNRYESIRNPASKYHWFVFGADQLLHQIVIVLMIVIL